MNYKRLIWIFGALFIIIYGNFYPIIKYNSFLGINSKWTRQSAEVWKKTHIFAGRLWFTSGILIFIYSMIFNVSHSEFAFSIIICILIFTPRLYSFYISRMGKFDNNLYQQ
ncbi:MAG: SdpI family protein [Bacteroidales bacterium]|nr:SdpI family protein [Bacteroidales bacterium]